MKCRLPIILSTTSPVLSAADTQLAVLASTSSSHKNRSLKQVGTTSSVAMVFPSLARRRFLLSFESSHLYRRRYRREQKLCKHILRLLSQWHDYTRTLCGQQLHALRAEQLHATLGTLSSVCCCTSACKNWTPLMCLKCSCRAAQNCSDKSWKSKSQCSQLWQ